MRNETRRDDDDGGGTEYILPRNHKLNAVKASLAEAFLRLLVFAWVSLVLCGDARVSPQGGHP